MICYYRNTISYSKAYVSSIQYFLPIKFFLRCRFFFSVEQGRKKYVYKFSICLIHIIGKIMRSLSFFFYVNFSVFFLIILSMKTFFLIIKNILLYILRYSVITWYMYTLFNNQGDYHVYLFKLHHLFVFITHFSIIWLYLVTCHLTSLCSPLLSTS